MAAAELEAVYAAAAVAAPAAPAAAAPAAPAAPAPPAAADAAAAAEAARRFDLALDLVAARFPHESILALRARDAASARDAGLRLIASLTFPRLVSLFALRGDAAILAPLLASRRRALADGAGDAVRLAAAHGHAAVVELLLADPRVALDSGALDCALENGHATAVEALLDAAPNALNSERVCDRVLAFACASGAAGVFARLARLARAAPLRGDPSGASPASPRSRKSVAFRVLQSAIVNDHCTIVMGLLAHGGALFLLLAAGEEGEAGEGEGEGGEAGEAGEARSSGEAARGEAARGEAACCA
jgi:hypothetical protein